MADRIDDTKQPAGLAGGLRCDSSWLAGLRRSLAAGIVAATLLGSTDHAAQAGVRVDGRAETIHLDVADAQLSEVLNALQTKFNLRYRSNDALDARRTGNFSGPLRRVVARLLDGYDFAITVTPEGIDVLILRQNTAANIVITQAPVRPPQPVPPPLMTAAEASRYERARSR